MISDNGRTKNMLSRREIMKLGTALMLSGCTSLGDISGKKSEIKPNIVVYVPDAMRADRLSCYGNEVLTTPEIDSFSKQGMLFERCYTQAPWTKPSVASLFTGFLSPVHQAAVNEWDVGENTEPKAQMVREIFKTLAENLRDIGYNTSYFIINPQIKGEFGFGRGFNEYRYKVESTADQMKSVLDWLPNAKEPYFVYIQGIDPHGPYIPTQENYQKLFGTTLRQDLKTLPAHDQKLLGEHKTWYMEKKDRAPMHELSEDGRKLLLRLYDTEIRGVDDQFRKLHNYYKHNEIGDRTIIALTSDHGESFGEHGVFFHGNNLYNEELHVPLIIGGAGLPKGIQVPWSVAQFDLNPTLVNLAGGKCSSNMQAQALLSREGRIIVEDDRAVFSHFDSNNPDTETWYVSMISGFNKVVSGEKGTKCYAFNSDHDPMEYSNILNSVFGSKKTHKQMIKKLKRECKKHKKLSEYFGDAVWTQSDVKLKEDLEALGYF